MRILMMWLKRLDKIKFNDLTLYGKLGEIIACLRVIHHTNYTSDFDVCIDSCLELADNPVIEVTTNIFGRELCFSYCDLSPNEIDIFCKSKIYNASHRDKVFVSDSETMLDVLRKINPKLHIIFDSIEEIEGDEKQPS